MPELKDKLTKKDFVSDQDIKWCPGCGDYAILAQVQKVFPELGIAKENIVVVGAGYIGLEIAASSRKNGLNVTVLEKEDRIMKRAVCSETSNFIQKKTRGGRCKIYF